MVKGSGSFVWEYWNGSAWTSFIPMSRDDSGVGTSYGNTAFQRLDNEDINLDDIWVPATTTWATTTVNGTSAYWIRMRLTGAITTVPVLSRTKLQVNSVEIDNLGIQFQGTAMPFRSLPDVSLRLTDDTALSPANKNIAFGANSTLTPQDNEFQNNTARARH